MKLKNAVAVAAIALATCFATGDLYAQKKKGKSKKSDDIVRVAVVRASAYGLPSEVTAPPGAFGVVPLKYDYYAVEKYIDETTMYIHFSKHYVGYLNNLNKAVEGTPKASMKIEDILRTMDMNNATLRNNAGGYYNHNMYFDVISPEGGGLPQGTLAAAIDRDFGSFEQFKKVFSEAGGKRFGSGWVWLVVNNEKLQVVTTANQDNPLMPGLEVSGTPILAMDVWEHAYYLKYQNKRGDYISNFFNVIDWNRVAELYSQTLSK
ncbi:MAG: superoxide dismutase [Capnocytophaga sp.]|uniref:superoxide dismutase n=1 Tax=Capnocytophaga sp. TaxID=44737 RepID=UPI003FA0DC1D